MLSLSSLEEESNCARLRARAYVLPEEAKTLVHPWPIKGKRPWKSCPEEAEQGKPSDLVLLRILPWLFPAERAQSSVNWDTRLPWGWMGRPTQTQPFSPQVGQASAAETGNSWGATHPVPLPWPRGLRSPSWPRSRPAQQEGSPRGRRTSS